MHYKIEDVTGGYLESYDSFEEAHERYLNLLKSKFHVRLYRVTEELLYEAKSMREKR